MRAYGVAGAQLERAVDRVLRAPRCAPARRLAAVPSRGRSTEQLRRLIRPTRGRGFPTPLSVELGRPDRSAVRGFAAGAGGTLDSCHAQRRLAPPPPYPRRTLPPPRQPPPRPRRSRLAAS